ncbi:GerMN domain-containing protein [Paenibacillus sp. CC-CFT747]|nr:GerMN domain-containing protein [Paenibacillus sp. CC-CFT747]
MQPAKPVRLLVAASLVVMLTSGCSLLGKDSAKQSIDPPREDTETMLQTVIKDAQKNNASQNAQSTQVTLYFKDDKGFVSPVSLPVASTEGIAKKTLESMVEDGLPKAQLPKGFTALLPKGTKVKSLDIKTEGKLAVVDFSKEFTNYNVQDERKMIEAITWALTGFPSIEQVELRVEGKKLPEMPMGATPLDGTLSRAMGINLEIAPG